MEPPDPFADLADEARAGEEVRRRAAARWVQRSSSESATFVGTLVDLAERAVPVSVRTRSGRVHTGPLEVVGADFLLVAGAYVRLAAVVAVRAPAGLGGGGGDRSAARDIGLTAVLADLAGGRPAVLLVPGTGPPVRGELTAAGADVVTVVTGGDAYHVPVDAVAEVVVLG